MQAQKPCSNESEVAQSCPSVCNPMDYTVHGILQARILEWVVFPFSRGSSWPRNQTAVSCIAGGFFTNWAIKEDLSYTCRVISLFSCSVVSASLRPHGLQHTRPPCPSPTPGVYSDSCPLSQWSHPIISSCYPLLLPPSIFPSIRACSNESVLWFL